MSSNPRPSRAIRRAIRVLLVLASVELASYVAISLLDRRPFSWRRAFAERSRIAASRPGSQAGGEAEESEADASRALLLRIRDQVVHPYLGYVFDPAFNSPRTIAELGNREITRYGFIGDEGFLQKGGPDRLVIGIAGGSVAVFFSNTGARVLAEELGRAPELAGKTIAFVTMALPGYKQPQQLFALAYYLTLGGHLDVLVNLDGFNELTLPVIENIPKGVAAIFPRSWYWRVQDVPDPTLRRWIGQVAYLEDARARLASSCSALPLAYSVTWNLIWRIRDEAVARDIARAEEAIVAYRPDETLFLARGPFRPYADDEAMVGDLVEIWARSSLQMHRLCAGNGIRYLHFLQPNQYVAGSKPMGEGERRLAISPASPFKAPVEAGYAHLISAGEDLREAGVDFHDLTRVFAGVTEPVYIDNCCHLNETGNRILAERIAAAVLAGLRAEQR